MTDYQWPSNHCLPSSFKSAMTTSLRKQDLTTKKIESFFEDEFNVNVVLVPSGRAAISLLLKHHKIGRSHSCYSPPFSSFCVWEAIGRHCNPTIQFNEKVDVALAVHKWAEVYKLPKKSKALVIEDSVDSIFKDSSSLFPNNGQYELISLPKTIGTYSGGLILIRNKQLTTTLREGLKGNIELGIYQSRLKYLSAKKLNAKYSDWSLMEHLNTSIDENGLNNISTNLKNYTLNRSLILERIERLSGVNHLLNKIANTSLKKGRCPSVLTIPMKFIQKQAVTTDFMIRNKSSHFRFENLEFSPHLLLPLHLGISNRRFNLYLNQLQKIMLG